MTRRDYLLFALLGLAVSLAVAIFQPAPGYMDADYYQAGGLQLANGNGFTEPYLWNYLDNPAGLPHPSHAYWMPLASILAAVFPGLFGIDSWFAARIPFYLAAACIPALTAHLAFSLTSRRSPAVASGLLAVFSGFYLPFITTTDTFAVCILFGGFFFVSINRQIVQRKSFRINAFMLGLLAGLMHLARADGLLWLLPGVAAVLFSHKPGRSLYSALLSLLFVFAGYALIMVPWLARNYYVFGSFLAPGGSKMLWLNSYDQIFSYPASRLSFNTWWQSGLGDILQDRIWALGMNMGTAFTVQGGIFLLPFIVVGLWHLRKEKTIQLAILTWALIFASMSLAFPFAGARGGFFHSGAGVQTVWWVLAPIGLERVIQWGSKRRGWNEAQARSVFFAGLVGMAILLSVLVLAMRIPAWGNESLRYRQIANSLKAQGMSGGDVVIVANPPGFYLASGNPAIAVPDSNAETVRALSERYHAYYLILEEGSTPTGLMPVYQNPEDFPGFAFLGEIEGARVFAIQP